MKNYKAIRHSYEALTSRVEQLIYSLLIEEKIDCHLIESRTKEIDSFENKIKRNPNKYNNPLKEITDLSGIRIILYYQDEVENVDRILRENFSIDDKNTVDKKKILKDNEFGYLSYHYVCTVNDKRLKLPEWKSFSEMIFEIQVRTVLQHAWASISHEIDYKSKIEIPSILKRKLFRLAGLIELADEEFQEVRDKHIKIEIEIKDKVGKIHESIVELNLLTIRSLFSPINPELKIIVNNADKAGFNIVKMNEEEEEENYFTMMLNMCDKLRLKTTNEFIEFIANNNKDSYQYFQAQFNSNEGKWHSSNEFTMVLFLMRFLNKEGLEEVRIGWSNKIWNRVVTVISDIQNE